MKDVELRLVAELMKNSRRSDRELAKAIGVSQPTVSRLIKKLEKQDVIKEYTIIPDFSQLGFTIMGATLLGAPEEIIHEKFPEIRKATTEIEQNAPHAALLAVNAVGGNKNRLFITFYEDYSNYADAMRLARQIPFINVDSMESLLVDLNDKTNYRILSMSSIANHLLRRLQKKHKDSQDYQKNRA
jgi:DNA-binding Lrp family transcriptional regulator